MSENRVGICKLEDKRIN